MAENDYESWGVYRKLVLSEIAATKKAVEKLAATQDKLHAENQAMIKELAINIAMLQVKSGVWGAIGGTIPIIVFLALEYLKR
jgi:VIT1/CCC1 family predicted Fe2+/Mn2+ transporter